MKNVSKDINIAKIIAQKVADKGGRTFFVGGIVRDEILKIDKKDIDIEIHNIKIEELEKILSSLGEVKKIGSFFGVFNIKGYDIDIAMPRREKLKGKGHKDFDIIVDPFIGYKDASLRRDFTMNSLMQDVLTGEIIDSFDGIKDINNKIIRHINDESFLEDPLRVFRAAQFVSRFGFEIDQKTKLLCSTMTVSYLAPERVFEELKKALLKSDKPSLFFKSLKDMNQLSFWFKEVDDLIGIKQSKVHHPEGDVFTHTMMVLDEAAMLRKNAKNQLSFMLAALCHDFGKITTTKLKKGKLTAYNHEVESELLAKIFLNRLTNKIILKKEVLNLVKLHMKPNQMYNSAKKKSMMNLWDSAIYPEDLILLSKADSLGRGIKKDYTEVENNLNISLNEYKNLMKEPEIMGKDLIKLGLKPGVIFSEYIKLGHKLHLSGLKKDEILKHIKNDIDKKYK